MLTHGWLDGEELREEDEVPDGTEKSSGHFSRTFRLLPALLCMWTRSDVPSGSATVGLASLEREPFQLRFESSADSG